MKRGTLRHVTGTREQTCVLGTAELGLSLVSRRRGQSTELFLIIEEACVVFSFLISYVFLTFILYRAFGPGQADSSALGSSCAVGSALGQRGNGLPEPLCSFRASTNLAGVSLLINSGPRRPTSFRVVCQSSLGKFD